MALIFFINIMAIVIAEIPQYNVTEAIKFSMVCTERHLIAISHCEHFLHNILNFSIIKYKSLYEKFISANPTNYF